MALAIKLIGYAAVFAVGVATPFAVDAMVSPGSPSPGDEPPYSPGMRPDQLLGRGEHAANPGAPVEPIPPYILALGRDHVTICWMTVDERIGELRLFSYSDETTHREDGPASRYHRIEIRGLEAGTTYRYEVGRNYHGTFTTASATPWFEAAVFGHPGGTERPFEYPTELLPGRLLDISPELALCTGDITYHATLRNFRDAFFHRFGEFMASKPLYVAASNHDGTWNGTDYSEFRRLFPHDFPLESGPTYQFDYKHARFFALSYKLQSIETFREHVAWLAAALDASDQEFNIVFMGGQEPTYYDKDFLFRTLAEHRVDLVLGGDGGGVWQDTIHGVPFFFAGDGDMGPYPFYYLRFFDYHFNVQHHFSAGQRKSENHRAFYSRKPKRVVQRLEDAQQETENYILHYAGLSQPSSAIDGVHLTIDWDQDFSAELQLQWKPQNRQGVVREQYHLLPAKTKSELLIALPDLSPIETKEVPYVLEEVIIRLVPYRVKFEDYPLHGRVSDVYLFAD